MKLIANVKNDVIGGIALAVVRLERQLSAKVLAMRDSILNGFG